LLAANTRLVAIERERRELKERITALAAQLTSLHKTVRNADPESAQDHALNGQSRVSAT
jgi:hypothetical protein